MVRILIAVAVVAAVHRPAAACQPVFDPSVVGGPVFAPPDAVRITSEEVDVACGARTCAVTVRYAITVASPAHASVVRKKGTSQAALATGTGAPADEVDLDSRATQLTLTATSEPWPYIDDCFRDGVVARHPVLGSGAASDGHVLAIETTAVPRVTQAASDRMVLDAREADREHPASTRLWLRASPRRFVHGGPVLLLGAATGPGQTFRLRGGWEAAIGQPWLVFAITGDTDARSAWNVAATAEATSRAWVLPLSFGAGGGFVLADGTRPGGRGQVSLALGAFRLAFSLDVIAPSGADSVDTSFAALLGGSL